MARHRYKLIFSVVIVLAISAGLIISVVINKVGEHNVPASNTTTYTTSQSVMPENTNNSLFVAGLGPYQIFIYNNGSSAEKIEAIRWYYKNTSLVITLHNAIEIPVNQSFILFADPQRGGAYYKVYVFNVSDVYRACLYNSCFNSTKLLDGHMGLLNRLTTVVNAGVTKIGDLREALGRDAVLIGQNTTTFNNTPVSLGDMLTMKIHLDEPYYPLRPDMFYGVEPVGYTFSLIYIYNNSEVHIEGGEGINEVAIGIDFGYGYNSSNPSNRVRIIVNEDEYTSLSGSGMLKVSVTPFDLARDEAERIFNRYGLQAYNFNVDTLELVIKIKNATIVIFKNDTIVRREGTYLNLTLWAGLFRYPAVNIQVITEHLTIDASNKVVTQVSVPIEKYEIPEQIKRYLRDEQL